VSSLHHVRAGRWSDGGAARYDPATTTWTAYDGTSGLVSYNVDGVKAEGTTVLAGPGGIAWVGTFGTADTTQASLIQNRPFWPAVINAWNGSSWSSQVFDGAGWVSSAALDHDGRLWVALTRGGAARDSIDSENFREDRTVPGMMLKGLGDWQVLDTTSGLPANDVSVVAVDPAGDVWVGTEGWGFSVYRPRAVAPTSTPVSGAPSPTPSSTRTATSPVATRTPSPSGTTPTRGASATPTRTGTPMTREHVVYLPVCYQTERN
jgi:ligand-binding sensor domain-containing protein